MDFGDTPAQTQFRQRVRSWLAENASEAPPRTVFPREDETELEGWRRWQARLADAGFAAVTWPEEHGGLGLGPAEDLIVTQELEAAGVAGVFDFIGVEMFGPTLMVRATEAQKERHLLPLLRGDEIWCQLFSEPGAGSDLAAVQTKAAKQPDGSWRINGQKVWTTHAQHAAFGILIARTGPPDSRHRGLSAFILPMDSAGITIRPLRQIAGDAEFNEVFLDDVVLDGDSIIGEPGEGWSAALTMLGFERLSVGSGHHTVSMDRLVKTIAACPEEAVTEDVRRRLGTVAAELLASRYAVYRLLGGLEPGGLPGPEAGLAKITSVRVSFDACQLAIDTLGPDGLLDEEWGRQISGFPGVRSAGGTEEILRNVVGERVLGLPPEPKVQAAADARNQ
jgi:alkylation response protein AidB-like acyl-CoA dehydrogenase